MESGKPKNAARVHTTLDAADGDAQDQAKCTQFHDIVLRQHASFSLTCDC
jgi:hypothetical protein